MDGMEQWLHSASSVLAATPLSKFLQEQQVWTFATLESLHLLAMTVLIGAIGAFDLRVLGLMKSIPASALHRLIPWAVGAFMVNAITGSLFVIAHPHQYLFDPAFRVKVILLLLAGLNVLAFYGTAFREMKETPAGADAPVRSRIITGISLSAWLGVLVCGALVSAGVFG